MASVSVIQPIAKTGPPLPRPLLRAQDGHSAIEQAIYQHLWRESGKNPLDDCRKFAPKKYGGYNTIGHKVGASADTVRRALHSLKEKGSIEPILESPKRATGCGTSYWVYSYRQIIKRRKAAGFTHYVRNRGGVTLWKCPGTEEAAISGIPIEEISEYGSHRPEAAEALWPVDTEPREPVGTEPRAAMGTEPPQSGHITGKVAGHHQRADTSLRSAKESAIERTTSAVRDDDDSSMVGESKAVLGTVHGFFNQYGYSMPTGRFPAERIAKELVAYGQSVARLNQFLHEEYRQRIQNPPATWAHVERSVHNWLAGLKTKALGKQVVAGYDEGFEQWTRKKKS